MKDKELQETLKNDLIVLKKMGYEQELKRGFSSLMAFTFCFTAVSVLPSIAGLYSTAMTQGGPAVLIFTWIIGGLGTIIAASSLAEICSTYPSAGSVYHWAGSLASEEQAPLFSYICGWFNLIGNAAGDAFFASAFASGLTLLFTLTNSEGLQFDATQTTLIAMAACFVWMVSNLMKVDHMGIITNFSALFQMATAVLILVALFATCGSNGQTSSAQDLFFKYNADENLPSTFYVLLLGLLTPLYSFTGYEAAGHMSEETLGARLVAPHGILYCAVASVATGFIFVLGMNYAVASTVTEYVANELAPQNVFIKCAGDGFGTVMAVLLVACTFFAGKYKLISRKLVNDGNIENCICNGARWSTATLQSNFIHFQANKGTFGWINYYFFAGHGVALSKLFQLHCFYSHNKVISSFNQVLQLLDFKYRMQFPYFYVSNLAVNFSNPTLTWASLAICLVYFQQLG
jgi:amino acid transporter